MVGFILMKVASCSHSVSPPKTTTTMAVTNGMIGRRRVSAQETASASSVATMNEAVAKKIGPPRAARAGHALGELFAARIGEEEDQQRPQLQRELEPGVEFLVGGRCGSLGAGSKDMGRISGLQASLRGAAVAGSPLIGRCRSARSGRMCTSSSATGRCSTPFGTMNISPVPSVTVRSRSSMPQGALEDEKEIVGVVVLVPDERALELGDHDVVAVVFGDRARRKVIRERRQFRRD